MWLFCEHCGSYHRLTWLAFKCVFTFQCVGTHYTLPRSTSVIETAPGYCISPSFPPSIYN